MLRDAALAILTLAAELAERGLTLKDSHPWNVLFHGTRPVWVDVTSVGPRDDAPGLAAGAGVPALLPQPAGPDGERTRQDGPLPAPGQGRRLRR